jgi:hypothetical protein
MKKKKKKKKKEEEKGCREGQDIYYYRDGLKILYYFEGFEAMPALPSGNGRLQARRSVGK